MNDAHRETERRFIIDMPDPAMLSQLPGTEVRSIIQTYLVGETGTTDRVRACRVGDRVIYTHTVKTRISPMTAIEDECEIDEAMYRLLLQKADPACAAVSKVRYAVPLNGLIYEIDIYPFWQHHAVMEVELDCEDRELPMPDTVHVVREITGEKAYSNHRLSRLLKEEEIPKTPT